MRTNYFVASSALVLAFALTACSSDSTNPGGTPGSVSLSFATTGAKTASASVSPSSTGVLALAAATDSLVITKAQVVLARLELQRSGGACASNESAGDDEKSDNSCEELELAPSIVSLSVNGGVTQALNSSIPSGTYSAFEAKIRVVEAKKSASTAFLAAHPEMVGASIRVEGTFNGKAFTYVGSPKAQVEGLFNPPLVADSTGANITINVDLTNWFRTSTGTLVDPATANAGGANAALVSSNIARSFKAFRDDDHDGRDDRGSDSGR